MKILAAFTVIAAIPVFGTDSPAQAESTSGESPLKFSGFVQTSYNLGTAVIDQQIVGRLYGRRNDEFSLDMFQLGLDRIPAADRRDAGFSVRLNVGSSATPLRPLGFDIGQDADLTVATAMLSTPVGDGRLVATGGRMTTLLGYEVVESPYNPNVSVGYQYIFVEDFTGTGLDAQWIPSSRWAARARITNGWDVLDDNNRGKTGFARLDFYPGDGTSIALSGYYGPEQPDNGENIRSGVELMGGTRLGIAALQAQVDYGHEEGIDAEWWAGGLWATLWPGEKVSLALRADVLDDKDGARTSGALAFPVNTGQTVGSLTATLALRTWPRALIRPEVRWDSSSIDAFDGESDAFSFALDLSYLY